MGSAAAKGSFHREDARFRHWITNDGKPGPTGEGGFVAERDRYHLYVSLACPWAHRTLIMRRWKGLEPFIAVSVVHWYMGRTGWTFARDECATGDPLRGATLLREIYEAAEPGYEGTVSVPVLWDQKKSTIVNNESADIIVMFNDAFDGLGAKPGDYYPAPMRADIDALDDRVYETVNNGVYRAGFATSQKAYDEAVTSLFETLDWLERRLDERRYLFGDAPTLADVRLFTTLIRFDTVYHGHFKCNVRRVVDYPALWRFTRDVYALPGVAETVNFHHIRHHYYESHPHINPTGIVPRGPALDLAR
jgi:putative glutathione S-transferase